MNKIQRSVMLGFATGLGTLLLTVLIGGLQLAQPAYAANLDVCPTCTYQTIQEAVNAAHDGDVIRVVAGTYTGTMVLNGFTATVILTKNITLLGGYDPANFNDRQPSVYTSTLDASSGTDQAGLGFDGGTTATVDGFRITGATGGWAGGVAIFDSSPTLSHNWIVNNHATEYGGGIYVSGNSQPTIVLNSILSNTADEGGGGITIRWGATGLISGNLIAYNRANVGYAGGIYVGNGSAATIVSNDIISNSSGDAGGGITLNIDTTAVITGNRILSNTTESWAAGGILVTDYATATILSNEIASNAAPAGWGGGIRLNQHSWATIANNLVEANSADGAPGIDISNVSTATIDANTISDNYGNDGGINISGGANVTVTNNVVASNSDRGIDLVDETTQAQLVNNTIISNAAEGVLASGPCIVGIRNNIIAYNNGGVHNGYGEASVSIGYNDLWDNGGADYINVVAGIGDISADPRFVDAANGDYHIRPDSPAMNTGTNTGAPPRDRDGVIRPQMGRVDMGAYEVLPAHTVYLPLILKR
jgi:parallel beta-helix repeat protein